MDEKRFLKEKIRQKTALIEHMRKENGNENEIAEIRKGLDADKERLVLLMLKERLERRINVEFDPTLSSKLDCLNYCLNN